MKDGKLTESFVSSLIWIHIAENIAASNFSIPAEPALLSLYKTGKQTYHSCLSARTLQEAGSLFGARTSIVHFVTALLTSTDPC